MYVDTHECVIYLMLCRVSSEGCKPLVNVNMAAGSIECRHTQRPDDYFANSVYTTLIADNSPPNQETQHKMRTTGSLNTLRQTAVGSLTVQKTLSMELTCCSVGSRKCSTDIDESVKSTSNGENKTLSLLDVCEKSSDCGQHCEEDCSDNESTNSSHNSTVVRSVERTLCDSTSRVQRSMISSLGKKDGTVYRVDHSSDEDESDEVLRTALTDTQGPTGKDMIPLLYIDPLSLEEPDEWPSQHHMLRKHSRCSSEQTLCNEPDITTRHNKTDSTQKSHKVFKDSKTLSSNIQTESSSNDNAPPKKCNSRIAVRNRKGTSSTSSHGSYTRVSNTAMGKSLEAKSTEVDRLPPIHLEPTTTTSSTVMDSSTSMQTKAGNIQPTICNEGQQTDSNTPPDASTPPFSGTPKHSTPVLGACIVKLVDWNLSPIFKCELEQASSCKVETTVTTKVTARLTQPSLPKSKRKRKSLASTETHADKSTLPVNKRRISIRTDEQPQKSNRNQHQTKIKSRNLKCGSVKNKGRKKRKKPPLVYDPYSYFCNNDSTVEGLGMLIMSANMRPPGKRTLVNTTHVNPSATQAVPTTCILITLSEDDLIQPNYKALLKTNHTTTRRSCQRELYFGADVEVDVLCEI